MRAALLAALFFCQAARAETEAPFADCPKMLDMAAPAPRIFWVHENIYSFAHLAQMEFRKSFSGPPLFWLRTGNSEARWGNSFSEIVFGKNYNFRLPENLFLKGAKMFVNAKGAPQEILGTAFGLNDYKNKLECDIILSPELVAKSPEKILLILLHEILHTLGLEHAKTGIMKKSFAPEDFAALKEWPLAQGLLAKQLELLSCAYGVYLSGEAVVATTDRLY